MKKIILMFLATLFLLNGVFALDEYVNFNGNFSPGVTLYSDVYPLGNYEVYAKDVYKDSSTTSRVCTTSEVCSKYSYYYETTCIRNYSNSDRCRLYQRKKIKDDCIRYRTVTRCTRTQIGCLNSDGIYTNQFKLDNFKVSNDSGTTWVDIPYSTYGNPSFSVNSPLMFKVTIPSICSPSYNINQAINIKSI